MNKQMIKDKRGLELKKAFFSLVAISMVIIAIGVIIGDWNSHYDSGLTYDLESDYNKMSGISGEAEAQRGNISASSASSPESGDFEGTSIRAVFGILNTIYTPFKVVFGNNGMLDAVTERFGLPDYIRQGFVSIMVFAVTFALITIFFGRRKI